MSKVFGCVAVLGCFLLTSGSVFGNVPEPDPKPEPPRETKPASKPVPLLVQVRHDIKTPKLQVPANYVDLGDRKGADNRAGSNEKNASLQKTRTMFAGLALSLAVGGFFFISRGANSRKVLMICLVLGVTGGAATLWAKTPPPDEEKPPAPHNVYSGRYEREVIRLEIEVGEDNTPVVLQIPESQKEDFVKRLRTVLANPIPGE